MNHTRIEINPNIMFCKPVIKGTRITVEQILRKIAGGLVIEEILADHPHLIPDLVTLHQTNVLKKANRVGQEER